MIVGMDFGTTNSGMAVYDGNHLRLIPLEGSISPIARTALYITNDRQVYIGRQAIDTYYEQNLNRPVKIERIIIGEITLDFADLPSFKKYVYVEKDVLAPGRLFLSFKTALKSLNYLGTVIGSQFFYLEDIIALYLYIAKQRAEQHLQTDVRQIVLGRPVHYSTDPQEDQIAQERMLKAAFRAGFEEVCFQYEPVAAAYHYETTIQTEQNVLIFDFGGGTLDISVMRLGNPKNRAVLATGGVPIAGDVFDQKLVRAKLPKHFGEGTWYRAHGKDLPVPSSFYEAFSNWQDILALQRPDVFEFIQRIELTAHRPLQIRALRNLVSSSYGLKMYDTVEAVKRQLSEVERALIKLDGSGFQVREPVTRGEFERIIRPEIRTIEAHLDGVLAGAGLKYSDIDAVIRTGGSSEIPAFIHLLELRFGREKVRSIDIFSSVTSGLGIIAHHLAEGRVDGTFYRREHQEYRMQAAHQDVPAVDFDTMKKFIALQDSPVEAHPAVALVGVTINDDVAAAVAPYETFSRPMKLDHLGMYCESFGLFVSAAPDERLLLMTSDYRFLLKTPRQLADMHRMGLRLAEAEGFRLDEFGNEHLTGISPWETVKNQPYLMLISTSGHFKRFRSDMLVPRIEQPVSYRIDRLKGGYPLALLGVGEQGDVTVFSASGRALRVSMDAWLFDEGRLMRASSEEPLIAAFYTPEQHGFMLAGEDATAKYVTPDDIPEVTSLGGQGSKIRPNLRAAVPYQPGFTLYAATTHRVQPIDSKRIEAVMKKPRSLFNLNDGETLAQLFTL